MTFFTKMFPNYRSSSFRIDSDLASPRRSSTDVILSMCSIDNGNTTANPNTYRRFAASSSHARQYRAPMQRAQTLVGGDTSLPAAMVHRALQGPMKRICKDCKAMIVNIIRASRLSLATAPVVAWDNMRVSQPAPRKPSRNFHLDLKPVYRSTPSK